MQFRGTRNGYDQQNELNDLRPWSRSTARFQIMALLSKGPKVGSSSIAAASGPALPNSRKSPPILTRVRLIQSSNHVRNFLDAIKSRAPSICPVEDAVQADILCHLSDIATRLGRKLTWDPAREQFNNDKEADARLAKRPVRKTWETT